MEEVKTKTISWGREINLEKTSVIIWKLEELNYREKESAFWKFRIRYKW